jgi:dTDP-4-dehydrorhamnose 3,5-epimerase
VLETQKIKRFLQGLSIFEGKSFFDNRGVVSIFFEKSLSDIFKNKEIETFDLRLIISGNNMGVVRGIHLAANELNQTKVIQCVEGKFKDYIFDFRPNSKTFLKFNEIILDSNTPTTVVIPPGLGHAFQSLENNSKILYLINGKYDSDKEIIINSLGNEINIDWTYEPILSETDRLAPSLSSIFSAGIFGQFVSMEV